MRETVKAAISDTVQYLLRNGIKTSFSEKELKKLGVVMPKVKTDAREIQARR